MNKPICHFFFRHGQEDSLETVLRTVIHQLLIKTRAPPARALQLYEKKAAAKGALTVEELVDIFSKALQMIPDSFLVLDGLDEFTERKRLLGLVPQILETGSNVLVTSRDIPDIRAYFANYQMIQVKAHRSDLGKYVDWRLKNDSSIDYGYFTHDLKQQIAAKIEEHANGS